jgi:hypothetical protein
LNKKEDEENSKMEVYEAHVFNLIEKKRFELELFVMPSTDLVAFLHKRQKEYYKDTHDGATLSDLELHKNYKLLEFKKVSSCYGCRHRCLGQLDHMDIGGCQFESSNI